MVHKLKLEHINLTIFSKMRVDLAAQVCMYGLQYILAFNAIMQVMSQSVSQALYLTRGKEAFELHTSLAKLTICLIA